MLLHAAGGQEGFWPAENVCQVQRLVAGGLLRGPQTALLPSSDACSGMFCSVYH